MIVRLSFIIVIVVLYVTDFLAMGAPILAWLFIGIYADFSDSLFFWGWVVVMVFSMTIWLKVMAKIRNRLWTALIERKTGRPDNGLE